MQLLAAKFNQIATAIEKTNAQIAALQAKLSELQEHQQQLQSVEQACQSALSQVDQALMMLRHVDPTEITTFKEALVAKFDSNVIGLIEPITPPAAEPAPEPVTPDAPLPESNIPIDVEVIEPISATESAPEPQTQMATLAELQTLSIQVIRKLAVKKSVGGSGTRTDIASRLTGLVTIAEFKALA